MALLDRVGDLKLYIGGFVLIKPILAGVAACMHASQRQPSMRPTFF
jgi:hypothetical protein